MTLCHFVLFNIINCCDNYDFFYFMHAECSGLDMPPGGTISFSNALLVGSVATQTCNASADFVSTSGTDQVVRTCELTGWSGDGDIQCES